MGQEIGQHQWVVVLKFQNRCQDNTASEVPLPSNGNNSNARQTFTNTHHIPQLPTR
jgi:hypothetical protein